MLAEQVRSETERAMRGQTEDMRRTAEQFDKEADRHEAEAERLNATLPRTRQIERTEEYTDSNGNTSTRTIIETVRDMAAELEVINEMHEIREQVREVRQAAKALRQAADELDHATKRINKLYLQLLEIAQDIDNACAIQVQAIKDEIGAYIKMMEGIRDSFGVGSGWTQGDVPDSLGGLALAVLAILDGSDPALV